MAESMKSRNTSRITFRPAEKPDSREIALMYRIASDGVADYIWSTFAQPGEDLLDVGQRRYEREDTDFSYQNCTMAVANDEVVGMLVAFPMHANEDPDPDMDPVLAPYFILEEANSYYVCGVAVLPDQRGQGIGSRFMALAEKHAMGEGLSKTSLIVFEKNVRAKQLYERLGYVEKKREQIVPHELIRYTGDAVLMVKGLS